MLAIKRARLDLQEHIHELEYKPLQTRRVRFMNQMLSSSLEKSHQIFHALRKLLSTIDTKIFQRTMIQRKLHEQAMVSLVPTVYKDDIMDNQIEIMERNNFTELTPWLSYSMPRRGGKTLSTIQFVAAALLTIPNINIICIAPGFRQTDGNTGMLGHLKRTLRKTFGFSNFHARKEGLEIRFSSTDVRTFSALSAGAEDGYVLFCRSGTDPLSRDIPLPLLRGFIRNITALGF